MNKIWSKIEDNYLISNYANGKKDDIVTYLNRSWMSIQTRASRIGLKKINLEILGREAKIWDEKSINYLVLNYEKTDKGELIKTLNRSWSSIQNKSFLLELTRETANANSLKLINESNEAYYWLGFIMADGHFNTNKQLQINLANKDLEHLKKFADFVEYNGVLKKPSISINYNKINEWLVDKFDISNNKTYKPCSLNKIDGDIFFSFIIGFVDGDGCISKKGNLAIKCHKSWLDNLNQMASFLTNGVYNKGRINSEGLAIVQITTTEDMKKIKQKINELNLPILNRKWERISFDKLSQRERGNANRIMCFELFDAGYSALQVIEQTKLSKSQVYKQQAIWKTIKR